MPFSAYQSILQRVITIAPFADSRFAPGLSNRRKHSLPDAPSPTSPCKVPSRRNIRFKDYSKPRSHFRISSRLTRRRTCPHPIFPTPRASSN